VHGDRVTKLGRYVLGDTLGEGGMGEVFSAVVDDGPGAGRRVCVKVMKPALAANPRAVELFLREARHAARLRHPKIVEILEFGRHDGTWFLAMELLDGLPWHDIAQRCWRHGRVLPLEVIIGACADAADALSYAHTLTDRDGKPNGIVHRDISPDNLFLTSDGVTRVLDFGIAKATKPNATDLTELGELRGKLPYMPPEQVRTDNLDGRADLWALGITMFYLATAQRPFDREQPLETMNAIIGEPPLSALEMNPAIPVPFVDVIERCLRKNPADRWPSARALRDALLDLLPQPPSPIEARSLLSVARGLERGDRKPLMALPAAPAWASWERRPEDRLPQRDGRGWLDDPTRASEDGALSSNTAQLGTGLEATSLSGSVTRPRAPERTTVTAPLLTADESELGDHSAGDGDLPDDLAGGVDDADSGFGDDEDTGIAEPTGFEDDDNRTVADGSIVPARPAAATGARGRPEATVRTPMPGIEPATFEHQVDDVTVRLPPSPGVPAAPAAPSPARGSGRGAGGVPARAARQPLPAWVFGLGAFAATLVVAAIVFALISLLR
jgi:serine/threonine protein kinase